MNQQTTELYQTRINFESRPDELGEHYQAEGSFAFAGEDGRVYDRPMIARATEGSDIEISDYESDWGGNPKGDRGDAADLDAFDAAEAELEQALRSKIEAMVA